MFVCPVLGRSFVQLGWSHAVSTSAGEGGHSFLNSKDFYRLTWATGPYFLIYLDTELGTECIQKNAVSATQNTFRLYSAHSHYAVCFKVQFSLLTEDFWDTPWDCEVQINIKLSCLPVMYDPDTSHHINEITIEVIRRWGSTWRS